MDWCGDFGPNKLVIREVEDTEQGLIVKNVFGHSVLATKL